MITIRQILAEKGGAVWTVAPADTVFTALERMAEKNVGALIVLEGERIAGIVSERDYARKLILEGRASRDTPVGDIMTTRVAFARPDQSVDECMAMMTEERTRHLPVLDDDALVGMVSIGDLVKAIITEQQHMISQLEQYIHG